MLKSLLLFLTLLFIFHTTITVWRNITGKQRLDALKVFTYSAALSTFVVAVLVIFVLLF